MPPTVPRSSMYCKKPITKTVPKRDAKCQRVCRADGARWRWRYVRLRCDRKGCTVRTYDGFCCSYERTTDRKQIAHNNKRSWYDRELRAGKRHIDLLLGILRSVNFDARQQKSSAQMQHNHKHSSETWVVDMDGMMTLHSAWMNGRTDGQSMMKPIVMLCMMCMCHCSLYTSQLSATPPVGLSSVDATTMRNKNATYKRTVWVVRSGVGV